MPGQNVEPLWTKKKVIWYGDDNANDNEIISTRMKRRQN